jgi:hypothetical protein
MYSEDSQKLNDPFVKRFLGKIIHTRSPIYPTVYKELFNSHMTPIILTDWAINFILPFGIQ